MTRFKIAYKEEAIADVEEIQDYLDQNAPDQCDKIVAELVSAIRTLEFLPKRNRARLPRKTPGQNHLTPVAATPASPLGFPSENGDAGVAATGISAGFRSNDLALRKTPGLSVYTLPVLQYLIYYRVYDDQKLVRILTVRHASRRPRKRFP